MSPRAKHVPANAHQTTVCLTDEEKAAINWIRAARRQRGDDRTTLNDILVDALWYLLEKTEGKTRLEMRGMVPQAAVNPVLQNKVAEIPKPKKRR
jgi:hypothetical protein